MRTQHSKGLTADLTSSAAVLPRDFSSAFLLFGSAIALTAMSTLFVAHRSDVVAAPVCQTNPIALLFGTSLTTTMTVTGDRPCSIWVRPVGASVNELSVTQSPQYGAVSPRGRTGVIYRAQKDFRGEDSFAFSMEGRSGANAGAAVVLVNVTVK